MRLRSVLGPGVALALALPWSAAAAEAPGSALRPEPGEARSITVSAESFLSAKPESAAVLLHFTAYGWTVEKSRRKVDETIQKFLEKLNQSGIRPAQAEVGESRLKPSYQFNRDIKANVPSDFIVSRSLELTFEDLGLVAKFMDASLSLGSFVLESARLNVRDRSALENQAFQKALESARKKAEAVAKSLDAELGDVVSVQELESAIEPVNLIQDADFAMLASLKATGAGEGALGMEEKEAGAAPQARAPEAAAKTDLPFGKVRSRVKIQATFRLR